MGVWYGWFVEFSIQTLSWLASANSEDIEVSDPSPEDCQSSDDVYKYEDALELVSVEEVMSEYSSNGGWKMAVYLHKQQ